jgi:hypothetical protein
MHYFFIFSLHFDRDKGLDQGRLSINSLSKGTVQIWYWYRVIKARKSYGVRL